MVGVNTMKVGSAASIGFAVAAEHVRAIVEGRGPAAASPASSSGGRPPFRAKETVRWRISARAGTGRVLTTAPIACATSGSDSDDYWSRFKTSCNASATLTGGDRGWFGIWNRRPEFKAIASGCSEWLTDLLQMSTEVKVYSGEHGGGRAARGHLSGRVPRPQEAVSPRMGRLGAIAPTGWLRAGVPAYVVEQRPVPARRRGAVPCRRAPSPAGCGIHGLNRLRPRAAAPPGAPSDSATPRSPSSVPALPSPAATVLPMVRSSPTSPAA